MEEKKELWMVQTKRADFSGLAMRLGVSPVAVRVMRNRGLTEEAEMRKYLYGTLDDLYDPRLMKGMEQAAELIESMSGSSGITISTACARHIFC